jgi:Domain of unknown function (DUF1707)
MSRDRVVPPVSPPAPPAGAERERVVQALCVHFAADHLGMEELEDRLARVYQSRSAAELESVVADLPALPADVHPGSAPVVAPSTAVPARGVVMALLGASERKGSWLVPRHLKVVAVLGAVEVDLGEGRFAPGVTEIDVTAFLGGVEVVVPAGVRVETVGAAFLGAFEADTGDATAALDASHPVLRVTGLAIMAGVEVKVRRPGKKMLARFEAAWNAARRPPDDVGR